MVSLSSKNRMIFSNPVMNDEEGSSSGDNILDHRGDDIGSSQENRVLVLSHSGSLRNNGEFIFKPVATIGTGVFLLVCAIALFIVSTVMPIECEVGNTCHLNTLSLLLYLHCLFWGISLICDQCIQYHHIRLRRRGYLDFYCETRMLSQLPHWTVSTWSALLLSVSTILHDYCDADGTCGKFIPLRKSEYITICVGLELVVLISLLSVYIVKIWRFNSSKAVPDVLRDDQMGPAPEFGLNSLGEIDEEIFQRQAELIDHYKEQNAMLRRTVLELNRQICTRTPNA